MKIYFVDNTRKVIKIKKHLDGYYTTEGKENCSFKMTKNDFVVLSDENVSDDGIEKLKNIIFLVNNKDYKHIWKLANNYRTIDIVDINLNDEYISNRIIDLIKHQKVEK